MEYINFVLLIVMLLLCYLEISKLKKQVAQQQKQLDELCTRTGEGSLASGYISDMIKSEVLALKNAGKDVEAVKELRGSIPLCLC